jgi:hypothetical protein
MPINRSVVIAFLVGLGVVLVSLRSSWYRFRPASGSEETATTIKKEFGCLDLVALGFSRSHRRQGDRATRGDAKTKAIVGRHCQTPRSLSAPPHSRVSA